MCISSLLTIHPYFFLKNVPQAPFLCEIELFSIIPRTESCLLAAAQHQSIAFHSNSNYTLCQQSWDTQTSLTFIDLLVSPPPPFPMLEICFSAFARIDTVTKTTLNWGERGKHRRDVAEIVQFNLFSIVFQGLLAMSGALLQATYCLSILYNSTHYLHHFITHSCSLLGEKAVYSAIQYSAVARRGQGRPRPPQ